jgi:hypothetical protein
MMKKLTIAAAVTAALVATAAAAQDRGGWQPPRTVVIEKREVQERLDRISSLLSEAIGQARGDREMVHLLRNMRRELDSVRDHIASAPPGTVSQPPPPPPPPQPVVYPIADGDLRGLLAALDGESFSDGRLRVLSQAAPANWFLVSQVQQLLLKFSFSTDKLQAARILKPRILDTGNFFQLYASFDFSSDKEELRKILEQ